MKYYLYFSDPKHPDRLSIWNREGFATKESAKDYFWANSGLGIYDQDTLRQSLRTAIFLKLPDDIVPPTHLYREITKLYDEN